MRFSNIDDYFDQSKAMVNEMYTDLGVRAQECGIYLSDFWVQLIYTLSIPSITKMGASVC